MNKNEADKIFEKYNPVSDKIRCPNGKAVVRKELDLYAKAAVNLYGIISRKDFVKIFNSQCKYETSENEIYTLLLPLVLKKGWYGFYKEYLVHYWMFDDFDRAEILLKYQAGKPRYVPSKDEFLKYEDGYYENNEYWLKFRHFMIDSFGASRKVNSAYADIKDYITYNNEMSKLGSIMERHNLVFHSEEHVQELFNILMEAKNNQRIWENNGHTPMEIRKIELKQNDNVIPFPITNKEKIGRNDPCPCGSGKKYKKCCASYDTQRSAQLSLEECRLFYETWYGLMGFVNERKRVIKKKIVAEHPNKVSDMLIHKVREVLWEDPEIIDEYIMGIDLPKEKIEILRLWKDKHIKGHFLIIEYKPEYAVIIGTNEEEEDCLYGVKGISTSISDVMRSRLPVTIEAVLLPFKDKIVYDSFIGSIPIGYLEGAKNILEQIYEKAKKKPIVTSLEG